LNDLCLWRRERKTSNMGLEEEEEEEDEEDEEDEEEQEEEM
jgi:hypothetical protein